MANEQDKDNDMQENKKDKSRKSAILTGVICVLLCIIGALYIWHKQTQKPPVQLDVNSAIATVDIDKLMSKHSDYAKLEKLQAEKILILIKLKSYALNTEQLQPPQVNPASQVFEQVVDEQNNLQEIKAKQQLKEETNIEKKRIYDRILEMCVPLYVGGSSYRSDIAHEKMGKMKTFFATAESSQTENIIEQTGTKTI